MNRSVRPVQLRRIAVCEIAAAMLLIAAPDPAAARREQASARPGWLPGPRRISIGGNLTAAQGTAAVNVLEQIEQLDWAALSRLLDVPR